jgi:hypothetical protein
MLKDSCSANTFFKETKWFGSFVFLKKFFYLAQLALGMAAAAL